RAERGRTAEADGRVDQSAGERSDDDCGDSDASPDISHDADHCPRDDDDADGTHPHGVVVSLSLLLAGQTVWIVARSTGVAALMRSRLRRDSWLALHRLSYVAFAAAFLHGVLSGTDLAYPWLMGVAWLAAAILAMFGARRALHAIPVRA